MTTPTKNPGANRYTGKCSNCGNPSTKLMRRTLDDYDAVVYDCPMCMMVVPLRDWPTQDEASVIVRQVPDVHCAICHAKAPKQVMKDHPCPGNILGQSQQVNQVNLTGWMVIDFPFRDPYINRNPGAIAGTPFAEKTKLCPKCAAHVCGTITHHKDGYHED